MTQPPRRDDAPLSTWPAPRPTSPPEEMPPSSRERDSSQPRRRDGREAAASLVTALFRLVKLATLHAVDNQATVRQVEETAEAVRVYGTLTGRHAHVSFLDELVLVGGQILQANRATYDCARELAALLARVGVNEVLIARDARPADFFGTSAALGEALRATRGARIAERPTPRVRLRQVGAGAIRRDPMGQSVESPAEVARAYAAAVVVMRRFYEALSRNDIAFTRRLKRVAQRLVDLSVGATPALLGVTDARGAGHDEARRAVNSAILSLAMARQVTDSAAALLRVALASLLFDLGRYRLAGVYPGSGRILPQPSAADDRNGPAETAIALTLLGGITELNIPRTVVAYEAAWVRAVALPPVYGGVRGASLEAFLIAAARTYVDAISPAMGRPPITVDEAIGTLQARWPDGHGRTACRLLIAALAVFPTGTLVELSTGEVAVVVAAATDPARYHLPAVRVVLDPSGNPLDRPIDVRLDDASEALGRHIRRLVTGAGEMAAMSVRETIPPSVRSPALDAIPDRAARTPEAPPVRTRPPAPSPDPRPTAGEDPIPAGSRARRPIALPVPAEPTMVRPPRFAIPPTDRPSAPPTRVEGRLRLDAAEDEDRTPVSTAPPSDTLESETMENRQSAEPEEVAQPADAEEDRAERTRALPPEEQRSLVARATATPSLLMAAVVEPSRTRLPSEPPPPKPPSDPPRPKPTAEGTFSRTPLVHLLVYILDQRLTGTATLFPPEGAPHDIFFQAGVPAKIRTGSPIWPLDRVLIELRLVDENSLIPALAEIARSKTLLGRHLVARGLLSSKEVMGALRLQLRKKIVSLVELPPETTYAFYGDHNLLADWAGPELTPSQPLATILAAARAGAEHAIAVATLARLSRAQMMLHPDADLERFQLTPEETQVTMMLRGARRTMDDLFRSEIAPQPVVRRTIYALAITRHLDFGTPARPPVGLDVFVPNDEPPPPRRVAAPQPTEAAGFAAPIARPAPRTPPPPAAEPPRAPEPRAAAHEAPPPRAPAEPAETPAPPAARPAQDHGARRAEIELRAASIDAESHHEVLGLAKEATADEARAAYFALARRWHPDRLPPELADAKPLVSRVFARIGEAYATLTDPQKRAAYEAELAAPSKAPEDEEKVLRAVNATVEFQKAEVFLRKNELGLAEHHIRLAVDADPGQPEYTTLHTWIQALRRGLNKEGEAAAGQSYEDLIKVLDEVLRGDPRYERALFYRGVLLKRSGKIEKAMRDFRLAAELNPRNLDAQREVRLFEMRKQKEGEGGLFGKWFNKK